MFDFGFSEIILTSAIGLIVVGPRRLPSVAKQLGGLIGKGRRLAHQFNEQLNLEVRNSDRRAESLRIARIESRAATKETTGHPP